MVTCVVGSGGKTTLIHKLANKYLEEGKKVLVTTTTHMKVEDETTITDDAQQIISLLNQNQYAFVGTISKDPNKIGPLSEETLNAVMPYADEILIEADGSRQLPLKVPAKHEPVLISQCNHVIVVTSLLPLGKVAKDVIHRFDNAMKLIDINPNTIIEARHIQLLLQKGYLEPLMNQGYNPEIQISQDNSLYQRAISSLIKFNYDVSILDSCWFAPKPRLFICGAGHVAKELADIASYLDFRIQVMDSRDKFATIELFPNAEKIICESFENLSSYFEDNSYYVVVTPGHQDDYECVKQILTTNYSYLGMIGSRKKVATTFDRLKSDGFSEKQIETVHAPIGLDIGANTPGEIAISILAQIIQIKNKHSSASISTDLLNADEKGTLCIIIEKTGSSPRGVGSMMLVTDNGQIDTLGGGAIENQVILDAKHITAPCIKEYDLGPSAAELGMICGGKNKILFIPV